MTDKPTKEPHSSQSRSRKKVPLTLPQVIKLSPFLEGLPESIIAALESVAILQSYKAGQIIFSRGEHVKGVYLLAEGKVRIFVSDPTGKERTIKIVNPGELFGEAALFLKDAYPAFSSAISQSQTFYVQKKDILKLITENSELALATIGVLANRLSHFASLLEQSLKAVLPRLAAYLLELPESGGKVKLPVKKVELARHLATTPESLSRALADLKDMGIVTDEKPYIVILNRELLEERADGKQA
ncbi:MAG: Crp/Fnr family transcriptional regulator [Deltaproteobacteria bacterium]|jgi:CRP/FNR family transcriptional regulator|nr:Crp/Fnr family transcriptional regulator [Deltaproteobacteria bacterium]